MPRAPSWLVAGAGAAGLGPLWMPQCRASRPWQPPISAELPHPVPETGSKRSVRPVTSQGQPPPLHTHNTFCPSNSCGPHPETATVFCIPGACLGNGVEGNGRWVSDSHSCRGGTEASPFLPSPTQLPEFSVLQQLNPRIPALEVAADSSRLCYRRVVTKAQRAKGLAQRPPAPGTI